VKVIAEPRTFTINLVAPDKVEFHQVNLIPSYSFLQEIAEKLTVMKTDGKKMMEYFFTRAKAKSETWIF